MTAEARWIMTVCLDRPEGWRFRSDDMAARSGLGRDKVRAARRELLGRGWLVEEKGQDPDTGQWSQRTHICDRPIVATRSSTAVERVQVMADEYQRQCEGQGELPLDDTDADDTPAPEAPPTPVDNVGENNPTGAWTGSPRADLGRRGSLAGQPGDWNTGAGQSGALVIPDRRSNTRAHATATGPVDNQGTMTDDVAQQARADMRARYPWLRGRDDDDQADQPEHRVARRVASGATRAAAGGHLPSAAPGAG